MDAGQVKEYAAPSELLADDSSIFFSMARDAGLVSWVRGDFIDRKGCRPWSLICRPVI